jgi:glycosidase
MKALPAYPSLYQINTRVRLTELSRTLGRAATLDEIPDAELDRIAGMGFDWVWFLSVWRTGAVAQRISRSNPEWRREFEETLPDLREEDIGGSGFAITGYTVHPGLGGDAALARLRERLRKRGLRLLLDFVPNHTAPDHPWAEDHPEYYVPGTEHDLAQAPQNYTRVKRKGGRPDPGLWAGPVLRRLAGHAATGLQQAGHAGGDGRGAAEDRGPM